MAIDLILKLSISLLMILLILRGRAKKLAFCFRRSYLKRTLSMIRSVRIEGVMVDAPISSCLLANMEVSRASRGSLFGIVNMQ